nr:MAG TPA: hypothetical protein [Caudoviricetes sp.]
MIFYQPSITMVDILVKNRMVAELNFSIQWGEMNRKLADKQWIDLRISTMKDKILDFVKQNKHPVNVHDVAKAIREPELEVMAVMDNMKELRTIIIPLSEDNDSSIWYTLK